MHILHLVSYIPPPRAYLLVLDRNIELLIAVDIGATIAEAEAANAASTTAFTRREATTGRSFPFSLFRLQNEPLCRLQFGQI